MAYRGIFWDIDGQLYAFPFTENHTDTGIAKSGNTYAHKKLWAAVKPKGCHMPYNYYPRGRVELTSKGKSLIYMNTYVNEGLVPEIIIRFELNDIPRIIYDNSVHYKCHFEDGWKADNSK
ncbi:MAG: hypothetical protein LUE14_00175 [Clostridiales bacterium]|nr:hypothetical protein [Clostridiales bacterium]